MSTHSMFRRIGSTVALAGLLGAGAWTDAGAQTSTGTIRGFVRDQQGAAVVGANVVATQVETNFQRTAITTSTGFYNLPGLPPGRYLVRVSSLGYGEQERPVRLLIGQTLNVEFGLAEQAIALEAIAVQAERGVETTTPEVATNITLEQIQNIPINDRNFLSLALLAPGVRSQGGSITSGAQSPNNMNVFLDGISFKNDMLVGGVVGQDASQGNPFPQAAIQEFRVITQQYKAEYHKATSAIISATTKSGTNEWHGEFFLFGQNNSLVAEDFFTIKRCNDNKAADPNYVCPERPKRDKLQGGFSLGGPLIRDRLFFFGTYEGNHVNRGVTVTLNNRQALQEVRPDLFDQLRQEEGNFNGPVRSNLYFGKLTYVPSIGSPHRFEVSANIRDEYDLRDFGGANARSAATRFVNDINTFAGKYQFAKGSWLNEFGVSYQTYKWNPVQDTDEPFNIIWQVNGQHVLSDGARCCSQDWEQRRLSFRNDLSYTLPGWLGDHVFKVGANVDFVSYDINQTNYIRPQFIFDSRNDYAFPVEARAGFGTPGVVIDNRQIGIYVQDDWAVSPRLTLNLGVRWDYETNESNNEHVTPPETRAALEAYVATLPCGTQSSDPKVLARQLICDLDRYTTDGTQRKPFTGAIQPRFGFSYDVRGDQQTVLFGGFGVYYDRNRVGNFISEIQRGRYDTYTYRFSADGEPLPNGTPTIRWEDRYMSREGLEAILTEAANPPASELHLYANDIKPPKTHHFTLGVRQAFGEYNFTVNYTGVRGYNFLTMMRANRRPDGSCCEAAPDNHWSNLFVSTHEGRNWYDALYLKAEKRYTEESRWGFQFAYTLGRAEQNTNPHDRFGTLNEFVPATLARYPSNEDERHRVTANWIVGLPFDIRFSGFITLGSGTPYNATIGFGPGTNNCTHGNQDCMGGNDWPEGKGRNWFRPEKHSFIIPDAWAFRNVDLRLEKRFPTFRGQQVALIAEVFNVFNFENFNGYDLSYGTYQIVDGQVVVQRNPNLGTPTSVITDPRQFGAPRRFQFGMRYSF
ncbi:MAG TPA: TonB-dependent receptor [Longimicrobiales bacterium]